MTINRLAQTVYNNISWAGVTLPGLLKGAQFKTITGDPVIPGTPSEILAAIIVLTEKDLAFAYEEHGHVFLCRFRRPELTPITLSLAVEGVQS
tara:strand:- start:863 stop:1141 length:279 start_codon:yes stop_codon:yes gene_type:complete